MDYTRDSGRVDHRGAGARRGPRVGRARRRTRHRGRGGECPRPRVRRRVAPAPGHRRLPGRRRKRVCGDGRELALGLRAGARGPCSGRRRLRPRHGARHRGRGAAESRRSRADRAVAPRPRPPLQRHRRTATLNQLRAPRVAAPARHGATGGNAALHDRRPPRPRYIGGARSPERRRRRDLLVCIARRDGDESCASRRRQRRRSPQARSRAGRRAE